MRRTERLLAIAEHLRARRTGVTAEDLAERFGVTVRTMYRDLASLREASLPIGAERGRGGGYALDRSYTLPPVNFSAREAADSEIDARLLGPECVPGPPSDPFLNVSRRTTGGDFRGREIGSIGGGQQTKVGVPGTA